MYKMLIWDYVTCPLYNGVLYTEVSGKTGFTVMLFIESNATNTEKISI